MDANARREWPGIVSRHDIELQLAGGEGAEDIEQHPAAFSREVSADEEEAERPFGASGAIRRPLIE